MYKWEVIELELGENGFSTEKEAYEDARNYFEAEDFEVGILEGKLFSLYYPGDSREGFLEFDGYGEISEESENKE